MNRAIERVVRSTGPIAGPAWAFLVRIAGRYMDTGAANWGTLIAWNFLFAFFPIILLIATTLSLALRDSNLVVTIDSQVAAAFPGQTSTILFALDGLKDRSGLFVAVAVIGLIWSGSSLFATMDGALSAIYAVKPRDFLPQRLMGVAMIAVVTLLATPILLLTTVVPFLSSLPIGAHGFLASATPHALTLLGGDLDATIMFAAILYVVPNRKQRLARVLPGAATSGTLFLGFAFMFPIYFAHFSSGFERFGADFALFFVVLTFFYMVGQITMVGGLVVWALEPRGAQPPIP
jgi:membrane protein